MVPCNHFALLAFGLFFLGGNMKVYLISGKARHGKDTTATYFVKHYELLGKKACVMHIGNYIKHFARDYFGWDGREETKPRTLLQTLGTDIIREKLGKPYFFTRRLLEDMEVLSHFFDVILIADVRLPMEISEILKEYPDAVLLQVHRSNFDDGMTEAQRNHITKTALDDYGDFHYCLENTTLEQLENDVKEIMRKEGDC